MLRDFFQEMLQIIIRSEVVRFCGFYDAVNDCAGLGTMDGVNDLPVAAANCEGANCPFTCRVIKWYIPVLQEPFQVFLLIEAVGKAAYFASPV